MTTDLEAPTYPPINGAAVETVVNLLARERLNRMIFERWPAVSVYCPATNSVAIIRIKPELICAISAVKGRSQSECFSLGDAAGRTAEDLGAISAEARLF